MTQGQNESERLASILEKRNLFVCADHIRAQHARITELEAKLVAEAARCKEESGDDFMRVCVIENDGASLIVPAGDLQNHIAEIADIEGAEPGDEISYTLTFKSMPRADVDALPEFNGF